MKPWMLYLSVGVVLAALCDWRVKEPGRRERLTNALLSVCAWPLFAPLVLLPLLVRQTQRESEHSLRIKRALAEARAAVLGTPFASLLPEAMLSQLTHTLGLVEQRRAELSELLARPDFQRDHGSGAPRSERRESVTRLWAILERDRAALDEMVELAESLRAQLLVARYSGRAGRGAAPVLDGVGVRELAVELSARVESLNAWFDVEDPHSEIAAGSGATDTRLCS